MKRNMDQWTKDLLEAPVKKAVPVLSFTAIQLLGITVKELINDSDLQARGMKAVADRTDAGAAVSLMDLSLEAECFGAPIRFSDDEVPTVTGPVISTEVEEDERMAQAEALAVPEIGAGRTQIYIDAIGKVMDMIEDRPVFAGVIGPFSLAGRLLDVTQSLIYCYEEPDMVHVVLEKCTQFIIKYIEAYKAVGANAYHFGNAVDMAEIMEKAPADIICMGNVDPAGEFRNGTPESIRASTLEVMEKCCQYPNFVISSGCDIPPLSSWDNIDAFFAAVDEFYARG